MDENIVNFIGGYATAIKEEIIKVSPHVVIGENILNDILAIIYVLGDYANMNNADGEKNLRTRRKNCFKAPWTRNFSNTKPTELVFTALF